MATNGLTQLSGLMGTDDITKHATYGNLQYFIDNKDHPEVRKRAISIGFIAASYGHLPIIEFLIQQKLPINASITTAAAANNHLDILQYAYANGVGLEARGLELAIKKIYVRIVQFYLDQQFSLQPFFIETTLETAMHHVHFEILALLRQHNCPCTFDTLQTACKKRELTTFQYALKYIGFRLNEFEFNCLLLQFINNETIYAPYIEFIIQNVNISPSIQEKFYYLFARSQLPLEFYEVYTIVRAFLQTFVQQNHVNPCFPTFAQFLSLLEQRKQNVSEVLLPILPDDIVNHIVLSYI